MAAATNFVKFLTIAVVVGWTSSFSPAQSAEINLIPGDELTIVTVVGKIEYGDDVEFRAIISKITSGVVFFNSVGGNLDAGIEIGKAIRLRQLATAVADGDVCASACALAWLGGAPRILQPKSNVGFHAAYSDENGVVRETGSGNARTGAYLNTLGLPENAAMTLMSKPPDDMLWLTPQLASVLKIKILYIDGQDSSPGSERPVSTTRQHGASNDELALNLVLANLEAAGRMSPDGYARYIEDNYAPTVSYFGRLTARAEVVAGSRRYKARWPIVSYSISTRPNVSCGGSSCEVWGDGEFSAKSPQRNAHSWGTFSFYYRIEVSTRPLIVAETSEVRQHEAAPLKRDRSLAERMQRGLTILGCEPGPVDGIWGPSSQAAMVRFNKANKSLLPSSSPTQPALDAITSPTVGHCSQKSANAHFELPW